MADEIATIEALRGAVAEAMEAGQTAWAAEMLSEWSVRSASLSRQDEHWLEKSLGLLLRAEDRNDEALSHLERAHRLDPRDRDVGLAYGELLLSLERLDEGARIMRTLLLQHKRSLEPEMLGSIYRSLGDYHRKRGEPRKARQSFDQALRVDPDDAVALEAMLATIEALEPDEAARSRRALLGRLKSPRAKAAVLLTQADDLRFRKQDARGALRLYDDLLSLTPDAVNVLRRKVAVIDVLGDPDETAELYEKLARLDREASDEIRVEYLERAYKLRTDSGAPHRARARLLEDILDIDPERLDKFEQLTLLYAEMEAWSDLAEAYKRMIARLQHRKSSMVARALPVLWRNLADLLEKRLDRPEEAIEAYLVACRLRPQDRDLRWLTLELCRTQNSHTDGAIRLAHELAELEDDPGRARRHLADLLIKAQRFDEALCALRLLKAEGGWSEGLDEVYRRLHRPALNVPEVVLDDPLRERCLKPRSQSNALNASMAIGGLVFRYLFANDLAVHGLTERERVDLKQPTLFSRLYASIAKVLDIQPLPRIYLKKGMRGMANAVLDEPAFVVGQDILAGRSERELAFIIGQQLCLQRPEFVLTTSHEPAHLKTILLVLVNKVAPEVELKMTEHLTRLRKELDRRLKPNLERHLQQVVRRMLEQRLDVSVTTWVEAVADEANRTGLLFCEEVEVADRCLAEVAGVRGEANPEARRARLHRWACSQEYHTLRRELGMAIRI
jgi:tetratricopeptide (TPR) repeat protein